MMKLDPLISKKLAIVLSVSLGTAIGTFFGLARSAVAQSANALAPTEAGTYQTNEQSNFGSSFGDSFNPFDLIHQANFDRGRNMVDFQQDSQVNINNAAEEFKRLQQERLQDGSSELAPETEANAPEDAP